MPPAPAPSRHRSPLDELGADPAAIFNPEWLGAEPTADPVLACYFLFHDCDLAGLQAALATVRACDPAAVASTYLLPTTDRTFRPDWMRHMARDRLGIEPVELPSEHNPYTAPDTVAKIIDTHAAR